MKPARQKKIREFRGFFAGLSKTDRIALVFHCDADGFCSAVIAAKAIERLRGKKPDFLKHVDYSVLYDGKDFSPEFRRKKINKAIFLDLSIDQLPSLAKKFESFSTVLVLDHHKIYNDLSGKKTVFIKAQHLSEIEAVRYPVSKMSFDLFGELVDISDLAWISCVGILGDMGYSQWKSLFDVAIEAQKTNLHELHALKGMIEAVALVAEKKFGPLFEEFYNAKSVSALLQGKHLKVLKKLEREVGCWFDSVKERAEFFPEIELVWLEIKSKFPIKSPLINRLSSELFPGQMVIVIEDRGLPFLYFSARRQDFKIKMNELLEAACKGIKDASAGGHVPAAAGTVPKKSLAQFKQNIIALLKKAKKKRA